MNILFQFAIVCLVAFGGQLMGILIPLPVPGNVYGLILMFILLWTGAVKLRHVEKLADKLLSIFPILFVPSSVGIMNNLGILAQNIVPLLLCCAVATVLTIFISGRTTQAIRRGQMRRRLTERTADEDDQ